MDFSPEEYEEILNIYYSESEEIIQRMNSCVLLLENDSSNIGIIDKLFRDAHSLKGASRMVGFDKIQLIAHKLEDFLDLAHTEKIFFTPETVTIFYKALDCLARAIQASVERKQEFIDKETQDTIDLLEKTLNSPELVTESEKPAEKIEKVELTQKEADEIFQAIERTAELLNVYDAEKNNKFVELMSNFELLAGYFNDKKCYKIKNLISNAVDKLKFVQMATGFLVDYEITEFKDSLNNIKQEFEKSLSIKEVVSHTQTIETSKNTYKDLVTQLIKSLSALEEMPENSAFPKEVLSDLIENTQGSPLSIVYEEIKKISETFSQKSIPLSSDVVKLLIECVSDCVNFFDGSEATSSDIDSIMQRLSIATQVIDLKQEDDTQSMTVFNDNTEITGSEKPIKAKEFFTNFENVSIKTLRVDTNKLDKLVNQMSELIVSRIKIQDHLKELQNVKHKIEELADAQNRIIRLGGISKNGEQIAAMSKYAENNQAISNAGLIKNEFEKIYDSFVIDCEYYNQSIDELSGMIKNIRVLPIATIFHQFPRMVRDIAIEKNKKIELLISGAETTVDKKIIEEIKSPLVHIVRNSIDHGIETPEERIKQGKPEVGKIIISAKNLSNKIVIEIIDDGRGVNIEKVKRKALATGLLSEVEMKQLNDEQIMNLIFLPGFSTGENVTEISGRGVGLDVVQSKITQLEGKVSVLSEMGKGATLRIELPLSLATIQAFVVQTGDLFFAIPILAVLAVRNINASDIFIKDNEKNIILDNQTVKVYILSELLNLPQKEEINENTKLQMLLLEVENEKIGVVVDNIEGDFEILQKKFSPPIFKLRFISGVTTLTSGRICYILNISDIFKYSLPDKTKSLIESKERLKSLNRISEQKNKKVLIFDHTEQITNINSSISVFLSEYKITNDIEELAALLSKDEYSTIIFLVNKDFENIFKFIYELKHNEMYNSARIVFVSSGVNAEIQKAFEELNLDALEFVSELDFDTCIYCIKKYIN